MRHIIFTSIVLFLAFLPAIIPIVGYILLGMPKGLNESNSTLATLPWLLLITVPVGALTLILYAIANVIWRFFS